MPSFLLGILSHLPRQRVCQRQVSSVLPMTNLFLLGTSLVPTVSSRSFSPPRSWMMMKKNINATYRSLRQYIVPHPRHMMGSLLSVNHRI
ncbi:hypothetical protein FR483_n686L [Paramecium bursaria Chlorella virus FR483]|uniref:Uncharacterized protein n686L n=1 Tax=Paramecium bursaria Chlorella virus FR483 TaxID=399781 RepID=A7J840_PBCVF|nr:hypothetical protein FR483_n686L [Paramecium bursaria Chlorella virus FR483]ABT15971.1 hypothetical protein FR483_n686L [Paramecium bursaria Chlorella virus FR483]